MKKLIFILAALTLLVTSAAAQSAELSERRLMNPTQWWWLTGVTAEQIQKKIDEGYRIFDLEIENGSPLRFSAVFVKNQGVHQKAWWWYYGLTADQVSQKIEEKNGRLLDIEEYNANGSTRYAVVMVSNKGDQKKEWWYYSKLTFDELQAKLRENQGRLIDWDTYTIGSNRFFSAVMISNKGSDSKNWWYYSNLTANEVKEKLETHKARLTDIEVRSMEGNAIRFSVLMEKSEGETWWWYYGKTMAEINEIKDQKSARVFDIEPYTTSGGQKRFAVLMLRNTNDHTERMRGYIGKLQEGGSYGFYVKRVDGNVHASLQADKPFYPASTIKVLQHVHAMCAIQAGTANLSQTVNKYKDKEESCKNNHTGHSPDEVRLENLLRTMMKNSDNQSTNAIQEFFGNGNASVGRKAMNKTAHEVLGMSGKSALQHKFGCGGPGNDPANSLTLTDLGKLYEKVAKGLLTKSNTDKLDDLMPDLGGLNPIIDEEAAKLGIGATNVQQFKSQIESRAKAGSFKQGADHYRSIGGWVAFPVKSGQKREYVFGVFIDKAKNVSEDYGPNKVCAELLRELIGDALKTYK